LDQCPIEIGVGVGAVFRRLYARRRTNPHFTRKEGGNYGRAPADLTAIPRPDPVPRESAFRKIDPKSDFYLQKPETFVKAF